MEKHKVFRVSVSQMCRWNLTIDAASEEEALEAVRDMLATDDGVDMILENEQEFVGDFVVGNAVPVGEYGIAEDDGMIV